VAVQSRLKASYNFVISHRSLKDVGRKTAEILRQVGLEDWADTTAKNLPYGLQRCLDIGISLATDPQLVLLDEPTSGVSREDTSNILELITAISSSLPVVLIEHNIDIVLSVSDMVTVLYQGVVLAEGPPAQIRDDEKVQEAYLGGY
jgi:branched-chain amino acid transport system ATP-binding protein